jgi:RNA polymerase sigma-70 factor (ECF subfamily)
MVWQSKTLIREKAGKLKTASFVKNISNGEQLGIANLNVAFLPGVKILPRSGPSASPVSGIIFQHGSVDKTNKHISKASRKMTDKRGKPAKYADESALILQTQNGCLESFNQVVVNYQNCIFYTAYQILCDEALAADATQEAFIAAFRNIKKYHGGSFKSWLIRIVTNGCYDELRRQKRRPTIQLEPLNGDEEEIESSWWLADSAPSPSERIETIELNLQIRRCLAAMPADYRVAVVLVDMQGMSYFEAAKAMRVPMGTIKSRLARARLRLREHLLKFGDIFPASFHPELDRTQRPKC